MLIDGVKFSCEQCIKGHRQTKCAHTERPLVEIQKRGRPATACDKCREARKLHNSHKTCTHHDDNPPAPPPVPRQLPHGAPKDLLRRSSSQQSRSSASSAPHPVRKTSASATSAAAAAAALSNAVASTSTSVASEEELATVGRKKSLSRPPSSRRSSSAAQKKPSRPHDLAHGHLADHPTHISTSFSPYPHHHHSHHAHSSKVAGVKAEPQTPSMSYPSLPSLAPPAKAPTPPSPARQYSGSASPALPVPPPAAAQERKMTNEELASAFFFRGFPPPSEACSAPSTVAPPPPPPVATRIPVQAPPPPPPPPAPETQTPVPAPRTLPLPVPLPAPSPPVELPQARYQSHPPPALPQPQSQQHQQQLLPQPILDPLPASFNSFSPFSTSPEGVYSQEFTVKMDADTPSSFPLPPPDASAFEIDPFPVDPAMAAFVLGPASDRTHVSLAPAYGQDDVFTDEPEGFAHVLDGSSSQPFYAFATTTVPDPIASSGDSYAFTSPSTDSLATGSSNPYLHLADSGTLPPPNPAIYGFPLHPVDSHTSYTSYNSYTSSSHAQSAYSGYESAASAASVSAQSVTGGAASALERLNLDLDPFSGNNSASYHSSEASSLAAGQAGGGVQTSSSSAAATDVEGDVLGQTDLDGILEWLASSATAGEFPSSSTAAAFPRQPPAPPPSRASDRPSVGAPPSLSTFSSSSFSGANGLANAGYSSGFASSASSLHAGRHSPHFPTSTFFEPAPASSNSGASSAFRPSYVDASIPAYPNQHHPSSLAYGASSLSNAPPSPVPIAVDEAGYEEDDEAEEAEPAVLRAREGTAGPPAGSTSLAFAEAPSGGTVRKSRRKRDPGLEMMRTATITCADQAGVEDEEEEEEDDDEDDDEDAEGEDDEEEEEDDDDGANSSPSSSSDVEARFRRGAFAARFGLDGSNSNAGVRVGEDELGLEEEDLERFGIDEDWLRRLGTQEVHLDFEEGGSGSGSGGGRGERVEDGKRDLAGGEDEEEEEERQPGGLQWWS